MAETSSTDMKDQESSVKDEELTREKLIVKYKTLIALTNKIKTARNDALAANEVLKSNVDAANEKVKVLAEKNKTTEEMLAALTEQKLKMAMEIDDLKKEKQKHLKNIKEPLLNELESCTRENDKIRKENKELMFKLREKEQNEIQLQSDLKKLHENNENVIILCSNDRKEKFDLQNKLKEIQSAVDQSNNEKKVIFELISKQFSKHFNDFNSLRSFFDNELQSYCKYQCAEEMNVLLDENLNLKNQVDELNDNLAALSKEKEVTESTLFNTSSKLEKFKSELNLVTSDRDKILSNLESVRLETKNLIENSEKLAEELETLKSDSNRCEHEMNSLIGRKNKEIETLQNQLSVTRREYEELSVNAGRECSCDCYKDNDGLINRSSVEKEVFSNRSEETMNQYAEKVLANVGKLTSIKRSIHGISGLIETINLSLLDKEIKHCESELLKITSKDGSEVRLNYDGPNAHCSCVILSNIGENLKASIVNYEKTLLELKNDVEIIKEKYLILLNEGKVEDVLIEKILSGESCQYKVDENNVDMDNMISSMEEHHVLNTLMEKKIVFCKEELDFALIELHNAEELESVMQREILSLKQQLFDVMSERKMLNDTVNDKIKIITSLDEKLNSALSKIIELDDRLKSSQTELNDAKSTNTGYIENENFSKFNELVDLNSKLVVENDSLKLKLKDISDLDVASKIKSEEEKNGAILDLKSENEKLKLKIVENRKSFLEKLSLCAPSVGLLKKQVLDLRKQLISLQDGSIQFYGNEGDSLKLKIKNILEHEIASKTKSDEEKNGVISNLKYENEKLKSKIVENSKFFFEKLSLCAQSVGPLKKEVLDLRMQFISLQENEYDSLKLKIKNIMEHVFTSKTKSDEEKNTAISNLNIKNERLQSKIVNLKEMNGHFHKNLVICAESVQPLKNDVLDSKQQLFALQADVLADFCSLSNMNQNLQSKMMEELKKNRKQYTDKECQVNEQDNEDESRRASDASKIQMLETSLALSKQELATAHLEINQLREDFHSYKVRAQSLLLKQKGELESQREKEAREQVEKLGAELDSLRGKMEMLLLDDEALKNRLSNIQSEKEITDKKYDDISRALHQKIIDYDSLSAEYNAFKLSTDTLIHNGKIMLEEKYKSEISAKDLIINTLKLELKEKQLSLSDDKIPETAELVQSIQNVGEFLQEREEGEGSETAVNPYTERHEFMSFDALINNLDHEDEENQVALLQEQVNMLNAELFSHEKRSKHLSSLLREAEKESARNAQQNTVLKEEVRRLERCLERQPLVANTEYLKNVVFKFLTLQSTDERTRLVPVLDSILKLSPVETLKLMEIAKGEGSSRWSNYLPTWTGLG